MLLIKRMLPLLLLAYSYGVLADQKSVLKALEPSVVIVNANDSQNAGVLLDPKRGVIVTANHISEWGNSGDGVIKVVLPEWGKDGFLITDRAHYQGRGLDAFVIDSKPEKDLALIMLKDPITDVRYKGVPLLPKGEKVGPGEQVCTVGAGDRKRDGCFVPRFGMAVQTIQRQLISRDEDDHPTERNAMFLETSIIINPGDSGGPVVNQQGRLVGIIANWIESARGLSNSIHVDELRKLLNMNKAILEVNSSDDYWARAMFLARRGNVAAADIVSEQAIQVMKKSGIQPSEIQEKVIQYENAKAPVAGDSWMRLDGSHPPKTSLGGALATLVDRERVNAQLASGGEENKTLLKTSVEKFGEAISDFSYASFSDLVLLGRDSLASDPGETVLFLKRRLNG